MFDSEFLNDLLYCFIASNGNLCFLAISHVNNCRNEDVLLTILRMDSKFLDNYCLRSR
jgi:hypothetical protein